MRSHVCRYLLLASLSLAALLPALPATAAEGDAAQRVAVLPFEQLSSKVDDEFLRAGFAESLTTSLARVRSLQVIERGRLRQILEELKLQNSGAVDAEMAAKIGKMAGAEQVLVGSFLRVGQSMMVSCRMVSTETSAVDGAHVAEVRKKLASDDDILILLDEVAAEVLKGFGVHATAQERQQIQQITLATAKVGAFHYYTEAREKFLLYTPEGYAQAVPLYEKAIQEDESYALAWAGLAEALGYWGYQKQLNGEDAGPNYQRCLAAARKAAELKPDLGEAHRALAEAYNHIGDSGDTVQTRTEKRRAAARRAIELNPRDGEAYYVLWSSLGRPLDGEGFANIQRALEINPRLSAAHLDLGVAYKEADRVDDAIRHYAIALEINPRDTNALNNIANAYSDLGKLDEAIESYRKALAIDGNDAIIHNNLGNALRRAEKYEDAVAEYQRALVINPKYGLPHYGIGMVHRAQKAYDKAEPELLKAIELDDANAGFLTALAGIYREQERYDAAIAVYKQALGLKKEDSVTHYWLGICYRKKADAAKGAVQLILFRQAIEEYQLCARYDPKDADPWFAMALVYEKLTETDNAIEAYRKATEVNPKHADAHYNLAILLKGKDERDGAVKAMQQFLLLAQGDDSQKEWIPRAEEFLKGLGAAPLPPPHPPAPSPTLRGEGERLLAQGNALHEEGKLDEAVAAYRKAIEADPNVATAHYNLGVTYRRQGKLDQAEACYLEAIRLDAKDFSYPLALGNLYRGQERIDLAIATYRIAVAVKADESLPHYWLGICYRTKADAAADDAKSALYRQATDELKLAAKYDPKDADPWVVLGTIYDKLGDESNATAAYRQATVINPKHADAHYNLAICLKRAGDKAGAATAMRRFLELAKDDPDQKDWIPKAEQFLRTLE